MRPAEEPYKRHGGVKQLLASLERRCIFRLDHHQPLH